MIEFTEIKVDCVLKGALMSIKATGNPEEFLDKLREIDPEVKFKNSFPVYGKGGSGKSTKEGKIITISVKANNGNKFIDLGCSCEDGDQAVAVSKKKVEEFIAGIQERLPEQAGDLEKPSALIMIRDPEKLIPIKYFEIDGKLYFDSFGG